MYSEPMLCAKSCETYGKNLFNIFSTLFRDRVNKCLLTSTLFSSSSQQQDRLTATFIQVNNQHRPSASRFEAISQYQTYGKVRSTESIVLKLHNINNNHGRPPAAPE